MANPIVTITMENGDVMKAELYPEMLRILSTILSTWCRRGSMTA